VEGEGVSEVVELVTPEDFLEGVKEIGVTEMKENEVACLMKVLVKPNLDNCILINELIIIMENFGIKDDRHLQQHRPKSTDMGSLSEKSVKTLAKLLITLLEVKVSI
jgi:hypothetical protein